MTEILIPKKNVILDSQILTTLMACARLTDFRFNLDLVASGGKSPSIEMGSIVHFILETYYKLMRQVSRDRARLESFAAGREYLNGYDENNNYVKDKNHTGILNCNTKDIELVFNTMEQYFDYYKNDSWVPIDVEFVKQQIVYEDDEVRIMWKAKLDLTVDTNQGIFPVDHKTMRQRRDTLGLNNQFKGQCIVSKTRGVIINKIGFQTSLKPSEKFTRPLIPYSLDALTEWSQVILPFYVKLMLAYDATNYWPPNYTHCENKYGFCQFKDVCSADTNMREEELRINFIKSEKWDPQNATND